MKNEIIKRISSLESLYDGPTETETKKTRKEIFEETGKIMLYPTELSYYAEKNGFLIPKGECQRKVFFKFFEVPETDKQSLEFMETMDLGRAVEYMVKKELRLTGLATNEDFEVEFKQEFENSDVILTGKKDVVLKDGTIIEIKSTKDSEAGVRMLKEGPFPIHNAQVAAYMLEAKINEKPSKLLVFYKGKINLTTIVKEMELLNDGTMTADGVLVKEFNATSMLKRMYELEDLIKAKKIPKRDYPLITYDNARTLYNFGVITKYNLEKIEKEPHLEIEQFNCTECPYKTLCRETE